MSRAQDLFEQILTSDQDPREAITEAVPPQRYQEEEQALRRAIESVQSASYKSKSVGSNSIELMFDHRELGPMQISYSKDPSGRSQYKTMEVMVEEIGLFDPVAREEFSGSKKPNQITQMAIRLIKQAVSEGGARGR